MESDNRQRPRVLISLSCTFGITEDTPRRGTITTMSSKGCFVKTRAMAANAEELFFKLWLPEQRWLSLQGTVLYSMEGIGFGLVFTGVTAENQSIIDALVAQAPRPGPDPAAKNDEQLK